MTNSRTEPRSAAARRLSETLNLLAAACGDDQRVRAAWLKGSFARGEADEWSDIDLHLLIRDQARFDPITWLDTKVALVLADEVPGLSTTCIGITPDWVHIDLTTHSSVEDLATPAARMTLLDPDRLIPETEEAVRIESGPQLKIRNAQVFLYLMGNSIAAYRRDDYIEHSRIVVALRDDHLLALLVAENGHGRATGKRLGRLLTAEQHAALAAVPPIGLDGHSLLHAQAAISHEYLQRGKRLAASQQLDWPAPLEQATVQLWRRELAELPDHDALIAHAFPEGRGSVPGCGPRN